MKIKSIYLSIFLTFIFTILSNFLFGGLKEIEKKYDEVFLEYQVYRKSQIQFLPGHQSDFYIMQGMLQGLKYAIDNFNSFDEITDGFQHDIKALIDDNWYDLNDIEFYFNDHQIIPIRFDHHLYCHCKD